MVAEREKAGELLGSGLAFEAVLARLLIGFPVRLFNMCMIGDCLDVKKVSYRERDDDGGGCQGGVVFFKRRERESGDVRTGRKEEKR
jgi:hypothetical protein